MNLPQNPAILPALYACQPWLFPWEGFHCPFPPFSNQTPWMLHWSRKIINCPFVLAVVSTGENKLMVMKPYRVRFRRWVWCDLPSSGVEPSSRGSLQRAEARSQLTELQYILMLKCCFFYCIQTQHISHLQHLLTNGRENKQHCTDSFHIKGWNIILFAILIKTFHSLFYNELWCVRPLCLIHSGDLRGL